MVARATTTALHGFGNPRPAPDLARVPVMLDTVLLKVASRCNLNCRYCYVYHMGDDAWRNQPQFMPETVQAATVDRLTEVYQHQRQPVSVVLHGGEPLLLGLHRLRSLCSRLRSALPPPCGIHVQTNGLLLTDETIDVCVQFSVGISVSIDGTSDIHDQHRLDHDGRGSYGRVRTALRRLVTRPDARPLFAGVLAVIDPTSDPMSVYSSLKSTGAPSIDFLVRDGNHARLPPGKARPESTEFGSWLARLLDVYLLDTDPPRIRVLDDMLRVLLGGRSQKEGVGLTDYGILVIDTDGCITRNDTLKAAYPAGDRFESQRWSILSDSLIDILRTRAYADYYRQQQPTAPVCRLCRELNVCGGGMVAHRWSEERHFNNPSVFCADQLLLIGRMREWLAPVLPAHTTKGGLDG